MTEPLDSPLLCSAKGCDAAARHQVLWNNPKLHDSDRRKSWLACDTHEPTLREFLGKRAFYRSTEPLD